MKKTKIKKNKLIPIIIILLIIIIVVVSYSYLTPQNTQSIKEQKKTFLTEENLQAYLEESSIIKVLPKDSSISLSIGSLTYFVKGDSISLSPIENPEISIKIPEGYLNKEYSSLCNLIREVNSKKDLNFETALSNTKLLWKYKYLFKYKECLDN